MRGEEENREEPFGKWKVRAVHHCAGVYRRLTRAVETFLGIRAAIERRVTRPATLANKTIRPAPVGTGSARNSPRREMPPGTRRTRQSRKVPPEFLCLTATSIQFDCVAYPGTT